MGAGAGQILEASAKINRGVTLRENERGNCGLSEWVVIWRT